MNALSRRTLLLGGALAGAAATSACRSDEEDSRPDGAHCFTATDDQERLDGIRVFQQAFPPIDDEMDASYPYWPCTDAATFQDFSRSSWTGGNIWALVWANRCNTGAAWNRKPNPLPAPVERVGRLECRAVFTTHEKANAATRCQVRSLLGMAPEDRMAPWLQIDGTSAADLVAESTFRTQPGAYCRSNVTWMDTTYRVMVDKVLLPAARLDEGVNADNRAGVMLDYEVQDGRRPEITEAVVGQLAHDIHGSGKQLFFFSNPFNAPTQQHTGCTADNLPRILGAVDQMGVFLWSGDPSGSIPTSYATQLDMLGPLTDADPAKLVVVFELGDPGTSVADAGWLHDLLHAGGTHLDKVMFWRNYATQGGSCDTATNQKISIVCFGE
jgi:hypothetical protein